MKCGSFAWTVVFMQARQIAVFVAFSLFGCVPVSGNANIVTSPSAPSTALPWNSCDKCRQPVYGTVADEAQYYISDATVVVRTTSPSITFSNGDAPASDTMTTVTNVDGYFFFVGGPLAGTTLVVSASKNGYTSAEGTLVTHPDSYRRNGIALVLRKLP